MNLRRSLSALFLCAIFISSCTDDEPVDCSTLMVAANVISDAGCTVGGEVELIAGDGRAPYAYSLDGINFTSDSVMTDLEVGDYVATVIDSDLCETIIGFTIAETLSEIEITTTVDEFSGCGGANGQITVSASGGFGAYSYSINQGEFASDNVFTGLTEGIHEISVMDEKGCVEVHAESVLTGVSFANDISPIFEMYCDGQGCHFDANSALTNLGDLEQVQARAQRIKEVTQDRSMPDDQRSLTQEEIDQIACWVDEGAMDN